MSTIRTPCEVCGVVLVPAEDILVSVAAHSATGFYEYECAHCETYQRHETSIDTVALLLKHGCLMLADSVPSEFYEHHHGAAITHDDLIDFHEMVWDEQRWSESLDELSGLYRR